MKDLEDLRGCASTRGDSPRGLLPRVDAGLVRASVGDLAIKGCTSGGPNEKSWSFSLAARIAYWDSQKFNLPAQVINKRHLPLKTFALSTDEEEEVLQMALEALIVAYPVGRVSWNGR